MPNQTPDEPDARIDGRMEISAGCPDRDGSICQHGGREGKHQREDRHQLVQVPVQERAPDDENVASTGASLRRAHRPRGTRDSAATIAAIAAH
jgi:hypothetical protein